MKKILATVDEITPLPRVRMDPDERRKMILAASISFFAESGLSAQTRDLAQYIGVSPALIFKYFGSKENLIECVYREVFLGHWNPEWERELVDRKVPLKERLVRFYDQYFQIANDYNWIRIVFQASLSNEDLTRRYISEHLSRVFEVIAIEIRHDKGIENQENPSDWEIEKVWITHSAIVYYAVREHIHKTPVMRDAGGFVQGVIGVVLPGLMSGECD